MVQDQRNNRQKSTPSQTDEYGVHSQTWLSRSQKASNFRSAKTHSKSTLILSGHGVSFSIEMNTLQVRNGFTHYPQGREEFRFYPGDSDLPRRIILLDCKGSISFHVIRWLNEQGVDLIHLDWQGEIIATATGAGYSADIDKLLWQRQTWSNPEQRWKFCASLIAAKLDRTIATLDAMNFQTSDWEYAIELSKKSSSLLKSGWSATITDLFMLEANCASAYFRAWTAVTIAWKAKARKFIPNTWYGFDRRSTGIRLSGNRYASHPINALLNYAYRVAESELLISAISEGYDPRMGILHEPAKDRNSFLLDMIELERSSIDLAVYQFLRSNVFSSDDFILTNNGEVRLNPQMARYVAALVCGLKRASIEHELEMLIAA